jgi:hypothetical protein
MSKNTGQNLGSEEMVKKTRSFFSKPSGTGYFDPSGNRLFLLSVSLDVVKLLHVEKVHSCRTAKIYP